MAHDLNIRDGKASMMYVGGEGKPWHGLGTPVEKAATSAEALKASGLDFEVEPLPMFTSFNGQQVAVPSRRAVVRTDTGEVLGTVGSVYKPVQNREAFAVLDHWTKERVRFHTAGALGLGERVWMLAKVPGDILIHGSDDVVEKYLLVSNTHDGSQSLRVLWTPIRVVCQNTLSHALATSAKAGATVWHLGDIGRKVDEAGKILGLAVESFKGFGEKANTLAAAKVNTAKLRRYFATILPMPEDAEKQKLKARNVEETHAEWFRLFTEGKGHDMPGVKGSLWAAYNAVTEWVDHKPLRPTKGASLEDKRSARLESIWFGNGANLKAQAFEAAMAMAK